MERDEEEMIGALEGELSDKLSEAERDFVEEIGDQEGLTISQRRQLEDIFAKCQQK